MIIRSKHDKYNPYLPISRKILRDRRLTSGERDCLIMMLSNSDDWEFSYKGLAVQLGIKRETVKARVQGLIEKGYISVSYPKGDNGKPLPFAKGTWEIREEPIHSARFLDTSERTQQCPISGHQALDTKAWTPDSGHQDLDTSERTQRNSINVEVSDKNYQDKNYQEEDKERENGTLSSFSLPPYNPSSSTESSQVITQTDLNVQQAFDRFCDVYPNLGDIDRARAAFLAIPDISNICHQIANSVEWFEQSGKWDNWTTGQKNVSCPGAVRFLKEGLWKQYLKSGATMSEEERLMAVLNRSKQQNNSIFGGTEYEAL